MRASFPATWSSHATAHLVHTHSYPALSSFFEFGGGHPADPLIPGKWSDI